MLNIQDSFASNESLQHQTSSQPHQQSFHWSVQLFQSNQRFRGPTRSGKARRLSHQSVITFLHSDVARHDSYSQFPRSTLGTPVTMLPFWQARKSKKEKKRSHFLSLAAKASMNKDLGWDTLEMRGRQFRVTLMYKLTHGLFDLDSRGYLIQHSESLTRRSHQFKLRVPYANKDIF